MNDKGVYDEYPCKHRAEDGSCVTYRSFGACTWPETCHLREEALKDGSNEPLTLADLWDMDGDPVWDKDGKCYLVDTKYRFCSCSDKETVIVDNRGMTHYPCFYTLYRRPPEGEEDT